MYVCAALINISSKNTALRDRADRVEEDIIRLESQVKDLEAQNAYYQTDAYQERLAREKLGLQAPGEQVVIVGRGDTTNKVTTNQASPNTEVLPRQSHIEEWIQFLFGSNKA